MLWFKMSRAVWSVRTSSRPIMMGPLTAQNDGSATSSVLAHPLITELLISSTHSLAVHFCPHITYLL